MNQRLVRTLTFVGGAAVCLAVAIGMSIASRPARLDDAALVGQPFYPDFTDATKATGLRVAAYDKEAARVNVFNVEFKDGLWRIPSHHNYPADGEEQLAKTAASVVGIERGLYAGKTIEDQKRLGVLDPLDESIAGTEGRGSRITLSQGGKPIVDLIVGNKADEAGNVYFVRKADEPRVYRAELAGLKVSTKFADWIEPDLLQLDRNKLNQVVIDRYRVDEQKGSLVQGEISILNKETGNPSAQWELEGLDAAKEKLKVATVSSMTAALDDLKIVGVREKPQGLVAVLTGQEGAALSDLDQLQMQRAGYFLTRGESGAQLVSNEGEILAGSDDGIRYTLRFGEVLSGSELEIEVGAEPTDDATQKKAESAEVQGESNAEGDAQKNEEPKTGDGDASVKKNRYLFITASFDESLLGERPAAPVKPVPPSAQPAEGAQSDAAPTVEPKPADDSTSSTDATSDDSEKDPLDAAAEEADGEADTADEPQPETPAADSASADQPAAQPAADSQPAADPAAPAESPATPVIDAAAPEQKPAATEPPAPDPQKVYEEALRTYEADLAEYERKTKEFDKKIEDGEKRAKELTDRFAPWYYVISADLFSKLKVERSALVEPVTPAAAAPGAGGPDGAGISPPSLPFNLPGTAPESQPATPAEEPAVEKPAEEAKPEAEVKPEAEAKPEPPNQ